MKITGLTYKIIIKAINILPTFVRNFIIRGLKFSRIFKNKFYKDLKYNGVIKVSIDDVAFKMISFGATIENEIYWKGLNNSLEPETIWLWKELCKNSDIIIDIGANTGLYSLLSCAVNSSCKVIAFEPSIQTFNRLLENIRLNGFNIIAENKALSNIDGELVFYDYKDGLQNSASLDIRLRAFEKDINNLLEYKVCVTTLDLYVKENRITGIGLIKIDVELQEPEVIEGMNFILTHDRPFIVIEVLLPDIADRLNSYFKKIDYTFYHFIKVNNKFKLKKVEQLVSKLDSDWNYFICPEEKESIIRKYAI